jgi:Zn-dependent peptidase ImmA (M78 family)
MARIVPAFEAYSGEIGVIERVTARELIRQARELAKRTSREIRDAGLQPDDFTGIAQKYGLTLCWKPLPAHNPGCYLKAEKTIILNTRVQLPERLHFTFDHELLHDRIEHDDDLLSLLADAYIPAEEPMIERLCNAGAAELLMPSDDVQTLVREHGFSTTTIPVLCRRYHASSIAVALQMIFTATHQCYLVIAEPDSIVPEHDLPLLVPTQPGAAQLRLIMSYTAASPAAKYSIKRRQVVPMDHPICAAWQQEDAVVRCQAKIPFASGRGWEEDCEALYYRGKVFAFFHVSPAMSKDQLPLL